jgi:hypothetical protein
MKANIATSVHARLLNIAQETRQPFSELLQYYAIERFLYRLSQSPYQTQFILKGALVFVAWGAPISRPTRDVPSLSIAVQVLRPFLILNDMPNHRWSQGQWQ